MLYSTSYFASVYHHPTSPTSDVISADVRPPLPHLTLAAYQLTGQLSVITASIVPLPLPRLCRLSSLLPRGRAPGRVARWRRTVARYREGSLGQSEYARPGDERAETGDGGDMSPGVATCSPGGGEGGGDRSRADGGRDMVVFCYRI